MCYKSLIEPASKRLVIVSKEVLETISNFRQLQKADNEAGGILIGKRRGEHFEITLATPPQAKDIRGRFTFIRYPDGHQEIAEKNYRNTDGEENYIGEWHTHPENNPAPSNIDISDWKRLSKKHNTPLLVIIAGLDGFYVGILINSKIHGTKNLT